MTAADETAYLHERAEAWVAAEGRRRGMSRRDLLRFGAATVPALAAAALLPPSALARERHRAAPLDTGPSPIVKPLPPQYFIDYGTNAEMRWDTVDFGYLTPVERFFVRDHTATPLIDTDTWRLQIFGSGLIDAPQYAAARSVSHADLLRLPQHTVTAAVECAGNGRSLFAGQQGTPVPGTQWGLGAIGVASWTGVPLSVLLERAGVSPTAVDVMPAGLDATVVTNGVDNGHVRRPFPIAKALDDVLVVHSMNGALLTPDHGAPVRILVPGWVGVANIKWAGSIEVSDQPLFSTWNTTQYRLVGPDYPDTPVLTEQVVKSAFQLAFGATLPAGERTRLRGRSWSGSAAIARVDVSFDGGQRWRPARLTGPNLPRAWARWDIPWRPAAAGPRELIARATDTAGRTQPLSVPFNTGGYVFGAQVRHPVTVVA